MKSPCLLFSVCAVIGLGVKTQAAPVLHIALQASATVTPDADGFFSLDTIAYLQGSDTATRARFAVVRIGRAPLSGATRFVTRDDIALKLRQAGIDPNRDVVLEGVTQTMITRGVSAVAAVIPPSGKELSKTSNALVAANPTVPKVICVHRGDPVTITIQDDVLTITAYGIAREDGAVGDTIRVHRDKVMTDLSVCVLDARTVTLENSY